MVRSFDNAGERIERGARVTTLNGNIAGKVLEVKMEWGRVMVSVKWDDGQVRPKIAPSALIVVKQPW